MTETTAIPESLQALKRAARERLAAAAAEEQLRAAREATALTAALAAAVASSLPAELLPFAQLPEACSGNQRQDVWIVLPGHLPLSARFRLVLRERYEREDYATRVQDEACAPLGAARAWWSVHFLSRGVHRHYHDLGAALAAAESSDPDDFVELEF